VDERFIAFRFFSFVIRRQDQVLAAFAFVRADITDIGERTVPEVVQNALLLWGNLDDGVGPSLFRSMYPMA
jgi:hypothetical protein